MVIKDVIDVIFEAKMILKSEQKRIIFSLAINTYGNINLFLQHTAFIFISCQHSITLQEKYVKNVTFQFNTAEQYDKLYK